MSVVVSAILERRADPDAGPEAIARRAWVPFVASIGTAMIAGERMVVEGWEAWPWVCGHVVVSYVLMRMWFFDPIFNAGAAARQSQTS